MEFDKKRTGTGTKEWSEFTENICRGCPNNCLYCYAAHNANRFGLRYRDQWQDEVLTKRAKMTSYPLRDGVVMFPSSHDITPFNLEAYVRVAKLILGKGNRLLIVSKPRYDCIDRLVNELKPWRDQIMFRFTIGSVDNSITRFWEPGAPLPLERMRALALAKDSGYATSVSIEPMLEGVDGTIMVVNAVMPFVTDTVWIGKMNKIRSRVNPAFKETIEKIESLQSDQEILRLYDILEENWAVRWKDSIQEVVRRCRR